MTTDEQGYHGWKNYETWATALHIDNDEYTYNVARQIVRDLLTAEDDETKVAGWKVAEAIKDFVEDTMLAEEVTGLAGDLLGAALSEVDWHEIAVNYLDEVRAEMVAS